MALSVRPIMLDQTGLNASRIDIAKVALGRSNEREAPSKPLSSTGSRKRVPIFLKAALGMGAGVAATLGLLLAVMTAAWAAANVMAI